MRMSADECKLSAPSESASSCSRLAPGKPSNLKLPVIQWHAFGIEFTA